MTSNPIVTHRTVSDQKNRPFAAKAHPLDRPARALPRFVRRSALAMRYYRLLSPIDWAALPERNLSRDYGQPTVPYAAFVAAYLVKIDQRLTYMTDLRCNLVEQPALCWLLGFHIPMLFGPPSSALADASLPTQRHLARMLRQIPNAYLQALLDQTVSRLRSALVDIRSDFGTEISLDTKHIIAWVKENNPKAYQKRSERFDKSRQPAGDPDCKLGCKRKRNQRTARESAATPLKDAVPAKTLQVGEYYWGYGSGVVATKIPGWGEFVLAELTQPFNCGDTTYFFPLMTDVERRLGFRPPFGTLDAAFDAFYTYEYFNDAYGFAAIPFSGSKTSKRIFDPDGLPLCKAGLPMPLKMTYISRTTSLIEHEKGSYVCPLFFPDATNEVCPIDDPHWSKGGCKTTLATSVGARIRHQLYRDSELYKALYKQRTATERINAQATNLGIERPKLRNGAAIANLNTLIYTLINLRALQRVHARKHDTPA
jgi:hypothetical protein